MTNKEAIEKLREFCKLKPFCELYPEECRENECEIYLAIKALEGKDTDVPSKDTIPMDWIKKYADDWCDIGYAYENPILGMLEDWRDEQDE